MDTTNKTTAARTYKQRDANDSAKLARIRELLAEASALAVTLEGSVQPKGAILRYLVDKAGDEAKGLHESAHFGATGELL